MLIGSVFIVINVNGTGGVKHELQTFNHSFSVRLPYLHCIQHATYHAMTFAVNFTFVLNTLMLLKCQACSFNSSKRKNVDILSSGVHR